MERIGVRFSILTLMDMVAVFAGGLAIAVVGDGRIGPWFAAALAVGLITARTALWARRVVRHDLATCEAKGRPKDVTFVTFVALLLAIGLPVLGVAAVWELHACDDELRRWFARTAVARWLGSWPV